MSACTCDHFEWFNATCPCCMGPQSGHDASGNRPCSCSPVVEAARRHLETAGEVGHDYELCECPDAPCRPGCRAGECWDNCMQCSLDVLAAAVRDLDAVGKPT